MTLRAIAEVLRSRPGLASSAPRILPQEDEFFVGRSRELADSIAAIESGARSLWIAGAAGAGKTELMKRIAGACRERGLPYHWLAPRVEPATSAVLCTIAKSLGRAAEASKQRGVLIIDDFELLRSIELWFVERFLPVLPPEITLVIASCTPAPDSRAGKLTAAAVTLSELDDADAELYLERRGVAVEQRASMIAGAEGNPGLLESAVSAAGIARLPDATTESHVSLYARHDTEHHRLAIAVLVAARTTPHELLEVAFDDAHAAREAFAWLSRLVFVEHTPLGLRPHTRFRKSAERELARHAAATWAKARHAVRVFADHRIAVARDPFPWVLDRMFVDRDLAALRDHVTLPASDSGLAIEPAQLADRATVLALASSDERDVPVRTIARWFDDDRAGFDLLRSPSAGILGYLCCVTLTATSPIIDGDPAVAIASQHLRSIDWFDDATAPDARSLVFRTWTVAGGQPAAHAGSAMLLAQMARRLLTTPALDYLFLVTDRPEQWATAIRFLGLEPTVAGEVNRNGTTWTVLAADWRLCSVGGVLERATIDAATATPASAAALGVTRIEARPAREQVSTDLSAILERRIAELANSANLSPREQEVLHLLVLGRNTVEIGVALHITARTARFHQTNVLEKIGAESRLDVVRLLL